MNMDGTDPANRHASGGCCGGGKNAGKTLAELELQLHALWARIQEERAKQPGPDAPAKKKSCCCG
jgi:hypothetical protein